jgi:rhodanese-related sulfurtransferase
VASWSQAPGHAGLIDVREPHEFAAGHLEGALNLPLSQLRKRLAEVPKDRPLLIYCAAGQRGYFAQRLLLQHGFYARNLSGGWFTWTAMQEAAQG